MGLTNSVFRRPVSGLAICPSLTFTIELLYKFSALVPRSAAVAGGDEWMKSPTAQMPERYAQPMDESLYQPIFPAMLNIDAFDQNHIQV